MIPRYTLDNNKEFILKMILLTFLFLLAKEGSLLHKNGLDSFMLCDTDTYMRLVRVQQLHDTGMWFDNIIYRSNAPYGEVLHWSRFLDLLLLMGAGVGSVFLSFKEALFWWGYFISPILMGCSVIALSWSARPLFDQYTRIIMICFFFSQPGIVAYYSFGRPDHHSLLLFLFILLIGATIRMLRCAEKNTFYPYVTGILAATGIWVSVEALAPVVLVTGTLIILWVKNPLQYLLSAQRFILTLTVCSCFFLLLERPFGQWSTVEYDKISIVHVISFFVMWGMLKFVMPYGEGKRWSRILLLVFLPIVALTGLSTLFPYLVRGPYAAVDPEIVSIWLSKVSEAQPLSFVDRDTIARTITLVGNIVFVLPYSLLPLFGRRKITAEWVFLNSGIFLFIGMTAYQVRFSPYAELLMLFPMAFVFKFCSGKLQQTQQRLLLRMLRITLIVAMALGNHLVAWAVMSPSTVNSPAPPIRELTQFLDTYTPASTILIDMDLGPRLLYETKHRVIATPYHRNNSGILYWYHVMAAETDQDAYNLLNERSVDLVVISLEGTERVLLADLPDKNTFYYRLINGKYPHWLRPVSLTENLRNSFKVFEVISGVE
ncbi:MAG: rane protein required for N-linked glycosylation-like protein [Firmicutes bacterium]|nr:rane protein required for N-linked glycosylation-like protein [Bacillota bacterium]